MNMLNIRPQYQPQAVPSSLPMMGPLAFPYQRPLNLPPPRLPRAPPRPSVHTTSNVPSPSLSPVVVRPSALTQRSIDVVALPLDQNPRTRAWAADDDSSSELLRGPAMTYSVARPLVWTPWLFFCCLLWLKARLRAAPYDRRRLILKIALLLFYYWARSRRRR